MAACPQLGFVHIPRTGGTNMESLLGGYAPRQVLPPQVRARTHLLLLYLLLLLLLGTVLDRAGTRSFTCSPRLCAMGKNRLFVLEVGYHYAGTA